MARQLPVPTNNRHSQLPVPSSQATSALARAAIALAPDMLRLAERVASQRLQAKREPEPVQQQAIRQEAHHLSEVEINFDVPFVRRIVMRSATSWISTPPEPVVVVEEPRSTGRLRTVGLLGASGAAAVAVGLLARKLDVLANGKGRVIDVPSRPRGD